MNMAIVVFVTSRLTMENSTALVVLASGSRATPPMPAIRKAFPPLPDRP